MTTTYEIKKAQFDVEAMPDYAAVRERFEQRFQDFVNAKKLKTVRAVLRDEIQSESLVVDPDFAQAIAAHVDDEALVEKRYIFLSVNPKALI